MSNYLEMSRKVNITWEDVDCYVSQLITEIKADKKQYSGIYGIPRGGVILAVMLSYRLSLPLLAAPAPGCLVVDEICATGQILKNYVGRYDTAVMHCFYKVLDLPTYYGGVVKDEWTVYPWE